MVKELEKRRILLCVCGSVAAYKAAELSRALVKEGAVLRTIMTESAEKFITPLTFESLTGEPVYTDMFSRHWFGIEHIELSRFAELVLIAPASYNTIGKISSGIADNLLLSVVAATKAPVLIVPAMNTSMYENPVLTDNINYLKSKGYKFIEPETGELACGEIGKGRFPNVEHVVENIKRILLGNENLKGCNVLITMGRTIEPIDPVRYISNRSSGRVGYWLSVWARRFGAHTFVITGPAELEPVYDAVVFRVETVNDMKNGVFSLYDKVDIVIMAAAVADFRVKNGNKMKLKKERITKLELENAPDILKNLGEQKKNQILVGFSLESENIIDRAKDKMKEKNLDIIVANDISTQGSELINGYIILKNGIIIELKGMHKSDFARLLFEKIYELKRIGG